MTDAGSTRLQRQIEAFFGGGRCFLLARGRVALYAGLRAINLSRGAKVLMPGYTCMADPSPTQFAGLQPVYVDIDANTYNIDPAQLDRPEYDDCAAVIVQHTYGIPCDMDRLMNWAVARNVPIIEDCCHVFGSRRDGRLCGTFGTFAFFSGQWNKPFSTGLGGMLLVNDSSLADKAAALMERESRQPSLRQNLLLKAQIAAFDLLIGPRSVARITRWYRRLGKAGLMIGSAENDELAGTMPEDYLTRMAACQVRRGLFEMARIEENIRHRTELTRFYHEELPRIGFEPVRAVVGVDVPLLRYPVRVANKLELLDLAAKHGVELGSWFESPLHPVETPLERYAYRVGSCPVAEAACREVVNLPTHLKISPKIARRVSEFMSRYAKPACRCEER